MEIWRKLEAASAKLSSPHLSITGKTRNTDETTSVEGIAARARRRGARQRIAAHSWRTSSVTGTLSQPCGGPSETFASERGAGGTDETVFVSSRVIPTIQSPRRVEPERRGVVMLLQLITSRAAQATSRPLLSAASRSGPSVMIAPEWAMTLLADNALSSTADDLAGGLFGASLFPWLAMLYWLKHPSVGAPPGVSFGLTFLLAFVFGTIPAAIGAGVLYGVSLADADWLHGAAESLLAITNCIVVLGFREALSLPPSSQPVGEESAASLRTSALVLGSFSALSALVVLGSGSAAVHSPWLGGVGNLPSGLWASEPANALSIPTWVIHTSSLVEWLVAMGLAWR